MSRLASAFAAAAVLVGVNARPSFAQPASPSPSLERRVNISADPVTWPFGLYSGSVSVAVGDQVAVRAEADFLDGTWYRMTEGDVSAPIYLRRTYHGPFIEPGFVVRHVRETDDDECAPGPNAPSCHPGSYTHWFTQYGPQALIGWHWTAESGVNFAIAAGATYNLASLSQHGSGYETLVPNGYVRVGYAF